MFEHRCLNPNFTARSAICINTMLETPAIVFVGHQGVMRRVNTDVSNITTSIIRHWRVAPREYEPKGA